MKKFTSALLLGYLTFLTPAFSQEHEKELRYWVIESNINEPKMTTVKFYRMNDLLGEHVITGRHINIERAKHRRMLDRLSKKYFREATSTVKKSKLKISS